MFRYPVPLKPEQLQMIALLIDATVDALAGIETQVRYVAIAMRRVAELDRRYPLQ